MKKITLALLAGFTISGFTVGAALADSMMSAAKPVSVTMKAQNASGETGTATLTQQGADIVVKIALKGAPSTAQPAHIHMGTCANLNPVPKYPLSNVVNGASTTTLKGMKLASLQTGGFAINVHKSATDIKTYVSCGDIAKAGGGSM